MTGEHDGNEENKTGSSTERRNESDHVWEDQGRPPWMWHLSKDLNNVKEIVGENSGSYQQREEQAERLRDANKLGVFWKQQGY